MTSKQPAPNAPSRAAEKPREASTAIGRGETAFPATALAPATSLPRAENEKTAPRPAAGPQRTTLPPTPPVEKPAALSILEIERFALHDGPGIRTVVFLQGCPLHCPWCANPESQLRKTHLLHLRRSCTGCGRCAASCPEGNIYLRDDYPVFDRSSCTACRICATHCPGGAIRFAGTLAGITSVMQTLLRDQAYYLDSRGGVTFSGGEPFVQFEGLIQLLGHCRQEGLHTVVETCGQVAAGKIAQAYPLVDLFLFDIKHTENERLRQTTGADPDTIIANLRYLAARDPEKVTIRIPVIPGFNDDARTLDEIFTLAVENHIRRVHLLPYHTLGKDKYEQMGLPYPYPQAPLPTKADLLPFRTAGEKRGLEIRIGG